VEYRIETIKPEQDAAICRVIKTVGAEFNAIGDGFGPSDAEVLNMSRYYKEAQNSRYLVGIINDQVVGGCGIAPFNQSQTTCELRKLFLLPQARGLHLGRALTLDCLEYARSRGYDQCYLETIATMQGAVALYQKLGFRMLEHSFEGSIHCACNVWMIKDL